MLTRLQFEAYLLSIKAPLIRTTEELAHSPVSRCRYYRRGSNWSDFAITITNCIAKDLSTQELNDFISSYYFDMDDPYDYYKTAIQAGIPLRLMSSPIIHTKAHLC